MTGLEKMSAEYRKEREIHERIIKLGICGPAAHQLSPYYGLPRPGEIERVEKLLLERRARMFKS